MSLSTKVSLFGSTSISTFGSSSSGGSGYGGSLVGGSSGSSLFAGYGYGTGLLGSTSGFGYSGSVPSSGGGGGGGGGGGATNTAPVFTSGTTATFPENGSGTVYTAAASDADGDTPSYSISGGSDASRFSINPSSGALSFNSAPDFEAPSDSNTDNAYVVSLQASDGNGGTATQTVTVTVTDEIDAAVDLTLTTGTDNFSPSAASTADRTTTFNDTISGTSNNLSGTLNDDDFIDGDAGTDSASFILLKDFNGFTASGGMESVEIVTLSNPAIAGRDFDATGVSGVTSWVLNHTDKEINLLNLPDTNATIDVNDATENFTLSWATTAGDQTVMVSFSDIGASSTPVQATLAGIEGLSIDVSGDNFVDFAAGAATSMTISGSGNLDMDQTATGLSTFNASGLSGDLTADLTAVAGGVLTSVQSGGGDDNVEVDVAGLLIAPSIDMGTGSNDRFTISQAAAGTATILPTMVGVEEVALAPAGGGTIRFVGDNASGVNSFVVPAAPSGSVLITGAGSSNSLILESGTATVTSNASESLEVSIAGTTAGTAGHTITSLASASVDLSVESDMTFTGTLAAGSLNGPLTLSIDGTATGGAAMSVPGATSIEIDAVGNSSSLAFSATAATSLSVSADADLDLTSSVNIAALKEFDISTNGFLDVGTAFTAFSSASIDGFGSVEFGDLGSTAHTASDISIEASGLAGIGTTNGGALEVGKLETDGRNITLDSSGILGKTILAPTVDASGGLGAAATASGDVTLRFGMDGFATTAGTLAVTATNVVMDLSASLQNVPTASTHLVAESFTFTGSSLEPHDPTVNATGEELIVTLSGGGAEDDTVAIVANSAATFASTALTTPEITIVGGVGGGDDTITVSGLTANVPVPIEIDASAVTNGEITMAGAAADDTLAGGDDDDTITGGAGNDEMTGGDGQNTFVFANADGDTPSDSSFDVITDFNSDGSDKIDDDTALTIAVMDAEHVALTAAAAGTAFIDAQGLATFDAADDSLTKRLTAVENALDEGTVADSDDDGDFVFFEFSGDTYVYISDGVDGIGAGDVLVQLEDVTGLTTSNVDGGFDLMLS